MITGMSTSCFFGREILEDTIGIMGKMGVRKAEVFLNTLSEYEPDFVKELRARADDNGVEILSVHPMGVQFEMPMYTPYERTVRDAEDIYKKVLDACNILGAKRYIYHGGLFIKGGRMPLDFEKTGRITGRVCDLAAERGIEIAYENVHWCWFNYPAFAGELIRVCRRDNLSFNLDIKQAAQSGCHYSRYMDAMGSRLKSVHICDYVTTPDGRVTPKAPFEGQVNFYELKLALEEVDYDGPVILELYSNNYRDYSHLKDIYSRLGEIFDGSSGVK